MSKAYSLAASPDALESASTLITNAPAFCKLPQQGQTHLPVCSSCCKDCNTAGSRSFVESNDMAVDTSLFGSITNLLYRNGRSSKGNEVSKTVPACKTL